MQNIGCSAVQGWWQGGSQTDSVASPYSAQKSSIGRHPLWHCRLHLTACAVHQVHLTLGPTLCGQLPGAWSVFAERLTRRQVALSLCDSAAGGSGTVIMN